MIQKKYHSAYAADSFRVSSDKYMMLMMTAVVVGAEIDAFPANSQ